MLSFDDDLAAAPTPPRAAPRTPQTILASSAGNIAGGILAPQLSNEPVHDLGVEAQAMQNGFRRVRLEDKRVINAQADVNQLVPLKYK